MNPLWRLVTGCKKVKLANERYAQHLHKAEHAFVFYTAGLFQHKWRTRTVIYKPLGAELECTCSTLKRLWFLFTEQ